MRKPSLIPAILFLVSVCTSVSAQISAGANKRTVALLDLTINNAETSDAEMFSAKHILKTAGIPFIVTSDVNIAKNYGLILASSRFDVSTFALPEKDSLISYVTNGGVLIVPNMKDPYFYPLFGIAADAYSTTHYSMKFNNFLGGPCFKWLNDSLEQTISLGDTSYASVISSRSYTLVNALQMAVFDDSTTAISKKSYGAGGAYALGFSFRNLIIINQQDLDYDANRSYSNGFEPTSDAIMLFVKGIYLAHAPRAAWWHTSPYDSKTSLIITHDVDATSAYDTMYYYSQYEKSLGIKASYFFTTHYINDGLLDDFYNLSTIPKMQDVLNDGHVAGSHSVGHFPDFDDEVAFPLGVLGNDTSNYAPYNSGSGSTVGGTVLGETEVSKEILENQFGITVKTFRAGHLCYNDKIINALDTLGYTNSTTLSAANVLTSFPYQQRKDHVLAGAVSTVWEYPMTISDVFSQAEGPISPVNYPQKVAIWLDVIERNMDNNAPNVLLIHPTRLFKLTAEQDLIGALPPGVFITNMDFFADYWQKRNIASFTSYVSNDTLTVIIPSVNFPVDPSLGIVVDKGQQLAHIKAQNENGYPIAVTSANFNTDDVILHFEDYVTVGMGPAKNNPEKQFFINVYPNPASHTCTFVFKLDAPAKVTLEVTDVLGNAVTLIANKSMGEGKQEVLFNTAELSAGVYFYKITANSESASKKLIISK